MHYHHEKNHEYGPHDLCTILHTFWSHTIEIIWGTDLNLNHYLLKIMKSTLARLAVHHSMWEKLCPFHKQTVYWNLILSINHFSSLQNWCSKSIVSMLETAGANSFYDLRLKGIVHQKNGNSVFTYPHIVPNMYEFIAWIFWRVLVTKIYIYVAGPHWLPVWTKIK